jgi:4-hydroxy-3-methylbut-2-en-1-yl diphosphate reductase
MPAENHERGPEPDDFQRRYFRKGLGLREEVRDQVTSEFHSGLVDRFRAAGFTLRFGDTTFRLAQEFGFCYGVERAVDYAYETLRRFPGRRIVLTGEIIHNPGVNRRLRDLGLVFLGDPGVPDVAALRPDDVVLLPAFGVTSGEFDALRRTGAVVVDTTCGSVLNVWKNVERYAKDGFTSLVHGKVSHEETRATVSRVLLTPGGHYLVVFDMAEALLVADYVRGRGDRAEFLRRFARAVSPGFDPDRDLAKIGVANQTTMLSSESLAIAKLVGAAMVERHGPEDGRARFRSFDTICSATQDRQDALGALIAERPDLLVVIGGYNSSNTGHLVEMAAGRVPAFHIEGPDGLLSVDRIRHKPAGSKAEVETEGWLPAGPLTVGLTAGASTPDVVIGAVVARILELRGLDVGGTGVPVGAPVGADRRAAGAGKSSGARPGA